MKIAFATSEAVPYSKTGGLADISGALPDELARLGHDVCVFTPYYRAVKKLDPKARKLSQGFVMVGEESVQWILYAASANTTDISKEGRRAKVFFIGCDDYFDRDGLYGNAKGDYEDNLNRFVFFSRACLAAALAQAYSIDIWHCHDWPTALIPVFLKLNYAKHPLLSGAASVFTIHNLSYPGLFWHWSWPLLNLPWQHYNWKELEFFGKINLLKGALVYADQLTTVSPTYSSEIQNTSLGCGLEGVLKERAADLTGIVNGIDPREWDPAADALLPANYSASDLLGKTTCKAALRKRLGLPENASAVVGLIGRLVPQKGWELLALAREELMQREIQIVVLGTGMEKYQELLKELMAAHPEKVAASFAFDNGLAHLIEAGSDMFLMPSQFEPCGLNQLYSLKYGTPPIVHDVGGLADTVEDAPEGRQTGFKFKEHTPAALLETLDRALAVFAAEPAMWRQIQLNGMAQDWSWQASAKKYVEVYRKALAKIKAPKNAP